MRTNPSLLKNNNTKNSPSSKNKIGTKSIARCSSTSDTSTCPKSTSNDSNCKSKTKTKIKESHENNDTDANRTTCASTYTSTNKPRNIFITDATHPLSVQYQGRFGTNISITVNQSVEDETWPGGAVWDLGWLLGQVLMAGSTSQINNINKSPKKKSTFSSQLKSPQREEPNRHSIKTITTNWSDELGKYKNVTRTIELPNRIRQNTELQQLFDSAINNTCSSSCSIVLELGCGVGLTGLIAAASIRPKIITIVTDLQIVIDKVTKPNIIANTQSTTGIMHKSSSVIPPMSTELQQLLQNYHVRKMDHSMTAIVALPLCWGNKKDESLVQEFIQYCLFIHNTTSNKNNTSKTISPHVGTNSSSSRANGQSKRNRMKETLPPSPTSTTKISNTSPATTSCFNELSVVGKNESNNSNTATNSIMIEHQQRIYSDTIDVLPDLIIVGDVAYQHYPGAPCHFDDLLQTILKFSNERTILIFGLRIRMPASIDLYHLLLEHFTEIIHPPLLATEIDPIDFPPPPGSLSPRCFGNHNITNKQKNCSPNLSSNMNHRNKHNNISIHFLQMKKQ